MAENEETKIKAELVLNADSAKKGFSDIQKKAGDLHKEVTKLNKTLNNLKVFQGSDTQTLSQMTKLIAAAANNMKVFNGEGGKFVSVNKSLDYMQQNLRAVSLSVKTLQKNILGIGNAFTDATNKATILKRKLESDNYSKLISSEIAAIPAKQAAQTRRNETIVRRESIAASGGPSVEDQAYLETQDRINRYLGVTQLRSMAAYTAINTLAGGFKYLLNYTVQYDKELHQLQAIAAISDTGLENLKDTIVSVANATKFTSLEVAQASTVLAQAGLSVTQIEGTLPAIANLATATGTDLATSTDVLTSTLNIYELQVTEAERVTNSLTTAMNESKADISGFQTAIQYAGNFASQLGMSFEETAAAIAAATQAGIRSKSMLGTGLRAVLTEFLKPTDKLVAQLNKVGLTVDDIDVKTRGFNNVLKTLVANGFGAEEAFKGMERRGAAFLAAIIKQTDYMDQVRLSMAGSTAAAKANEIQMKSLSNLWDNFRSISGNLVSEGLEPVVDIFRVLLSNLNDFLQLKAVNKLGSILFGTVSIIAAGKSLNYVGGVLLKIKETLSAIAVVKAGTAVAGTISAVAEGGKAVATTTTLLAKMGSVLKYLLTAIGGWSTVLIAVGLGAYQVAKYFGVFETEVDVARSAVEKANGALEEARVSLDAVRSMMDKLNVSQERLDSQAERNIFAREIISRFPEAQRLFDATAASVDDLRNVLEQLNDIKLDKFIKQATEAANAAAQLARAQEGKTASKLGRANRGYLENFFSFESTVLNKQQSQQVQLAGALGNPYLAHRLQTTEDSDTKISIARNAIKASVYGLSNKEAADKLKTLSQELQNLALAAGESESVWKDLVDSLQDFYAKKDIQSSAKDLKDTKVIFKDSIDATSEGMRKTADEAKAMSEKIEKEMEDGSKDILQILEDSQNEYSRILAESEKIHNQQVALAEVSSRESFQTATGMSIEDVNRLFDEAISKSEELSRLQKEGVDQSVIDAKVIQNYKTALADTLGNLEGSLQEFTGKLQLIVQKIDPNADFSKKGIASAQRTLRDKNASKEQRTEAARLYVAGASATAGYDKYAAQVGAIGISKLAAGTSAEELIKELNIQFDKEADKLEFTKILQNVSTAFANVESKINVSAERMDEYFRKIKASANEAETAYNNTIAKLEAPFSEQRGKVEAYRRVYGSDSLITQTEQRRLEYMQDTPSREDLEVRKRATEALRDNYDALLNNLRSNENYKKYQEEATKTQQRLDVTLQNGTAEQIENARKQRDIAAKNWETFTSLEKDYSEKSTKLSQEVDELDATITEEIEARKKSSSVTEGIKRGTLTYQQKLGQEDLTAAGTAAKVTNAALEELESSASDAFIAILDGTKKSSQAFKDLGRSVLETMRNVLVQEATKQFMALLFGTNSGTSGTSSGSSSSGWVSTLFSAGVAYFSGGAGGAPTAAAQGGIVRGPVKNRDSVPTMLMPGEYVLKKSAVDTLGKGYLDNLNADAASGMSSISSDVQSSLTTDSSGEDKPAGNGVVNVYVVSQASQSQMGPKDVLVTISNDILTGGQTKKLIKQVAMGGI